MAIVPGRTALAIVLEDVLLEPVEGDARRNRAGMMRSVSMSLPRSGSAAARDRR